MTRSGTRAGLDLAAVLRRDADDLQEDLNRGLREEAASDREAALAEEL